MYLVCSCKTEQITVTVKMQNEVLTLQFVNKTYSLILNIIILCLNCSAAVHFLAVKMCSPRLCIALWATRNQCGLHIWKRVSNNFVSLPDTVACILSLPE